MKRNVRYCLTCAFLGCGLLICGCGSPKMEPVPNRLVSAFPYRAEHAGLEIAVDLYSEPGRVKRHFGTNLLAQQIVPVQVVFHNVEMQGGFLLQPELVVFMKQTGSEIEPGRGYPNVPSAGIGPTVGLVSPLLSIPVRLIEENAMWAAVDISNHMELLRFRDRPLYSSDSNSGFIYFKLDDISSLNKAAALRFSIKNIRSGEEMVVVVPIVKN